MLKEATSPERTPGPVERKIVEKLTSALSPEHLEIINQSHLHAGHEGLREHADRFSAGESHFKIVLRSSQFNGLTRVQSHRLVHDILKDELTLGLIHALALVTEEATNGTASTTA